MENENIGIGIEVTHEERIGIATQIETENDGVIDQEIEIGRRTADMKREGGTIPTSLEHGRDQGLEIGEEIVTMIGEIGESRDQDRGLDIVETKSPRVTDGKETMNVETDDREACHLAKCPTMISSCINNDTTDFLQSDLLTI